MGNSSSHPPNKRDHPPNKLDHPPPAKEQPSSPFTRTASRLKHKKRSIVEHPQLLAPQSPASTVPSSPIPIPVQPGQSTHHRAAPNEPSSVADYDPDLLSYNRDENHYHTHRPIQYNSTRSFGGVRRGGVQGGGWPTNDDHQPHQHRPPPPPAFREEIVRSSIPLRITQPAERRGERSPAKESSPHDLEFNNGGQIPTQILWKDGGNDVLVAGTFNELEWRARERMRFECVPSPFSHARFSSLTLFAVR